MNKKQKIKLLTEAWAFLFAYLQDHSRNVGKHYYNQLMKEEKDHRRYSWVPEVPNNLTAPEGAKLFGVMYVAQFLLGQTIPPVADYFHIRTSRYMAYAIASEYQEGIKKTWAKFNIAELADLDYSELNKV